MSKSSRSISLLLVMAVCMPCAVAQQETAADADRLDQQASELYLHSKFTQAVSIAERAAEIRKQALGKDHPAYAASLSNVAQLYRAMGQYQKAEQLVRQALEIYQRALPTNDPDLIEHFCFALNQAAYLNSVMGRYEDAERLSRQALEVSKKLGPGHPQYGHSLSNLGMLYYSLGQYKKAEPLYQEALEIYRRVQPNEPDYYLSYTLGLNNLGLLYEAMERYDKAEPLLQQAVEVTRKVLGESYPDYATSLNNLAFLYDSMGEYQKAERLYQQALEIRKTLLGQNHPDYAVGLNNLATVYEYMGQFEKAEPLLQDALEITKRALGPDHPQYATCLDNLAELYQSMGQYRKAEPPLRQALEIRERALGLDHPHYAMSLKGLGDLYHLMGQYQKAEPLYQQALEIVKKVLGENHTEYATSLNNLGLLYDDMGQYRKAEALLQQGLEITKAALGPDHPDYAMSLNNLAMVYIYMGQYQKAGSLLQQALEIEKRSVGENHTQYADSLNNLALVYDSMGEYQKAEPLYQQALEIKRALGPNHPQYAMSLHNLGTLYHSMGQYQKAEPLLRQALEIRERALGPDHPQYAMSLNGLGELYYSMGQYEKAEPLLRQALEITKKRLGSTHHDYAASLENLAILWQAAGRPKQSMDAFAHVMQIEQDNINAVFSFTSEAAMRDFLNTTRGSLFGLVSLGLNEGSRDPAVNPITTQWILRRKGMVFDALSRFQLAQRLQATDPAVAQKAVRVRELKQRLHNLALNPPKDLDSGALQHERDGAQAELDLVQAELNQRLSAVSPTVEAQTSAIQQQLLPGTVLVEFLRVSIYDFKAMSTTEHWKPAHYVAVVIRRDASPRLIDLGEADDIDKQVKNVRQAIDDFAKLPPSVWAEQEKSAEEDFQSASAELYHAIFTPQLKQALGNAETIYVAPDGELNQVAFESLVDEQHHYLVESHSFVYLTTGRDLLRPQISLGKGTVVFAAPDYNLGVRERRAEAGVLMAGSQNTTAGALGAASRDLRGGNWKPLPGAPLEAKDIRELLGNSQFGPVTSYEDKRALEEVFLNLRSPRVLHVATHGYFLPDQKMDPADREMITGDSSLETGAARGLGRLRGTEDPLLRSGLVFAGANLVGSQDASSAHIGDGWVTAEEVSMMDLRGTGLVVLSACESGLGDVRSDGVQGLRRAFLLAGARSLVMSLYKVPDTDTRGLMRQFYRRLKNGESKATALHDAQLQMIQERRKAHGAAHPFFWGSFVLLGEPN